MGGAAEHCHFPDSAAAGVAAHRHHVRHGYDLVFHSETFPSRLHRSRQLSQASAVLLCVPGDRLYRLGNCLCLGTPPPRRQRRRLAYRQLFSIVLFKTLKRALEGRKFAWDKLERTAAVNYIPSENRDPVNVPQSRAVVVPSSRLLRLVHPKRSVEVSAFAKRKQMRSRRISAIAGSTAGTKRSSLFDGRRLRE